MPTETKGRNELASPNLGFSDYQEAPVTLHLKPYTGASQTSLVYIQIIWNLIKM